MKGHKMGETQARIWASLTVNILPQPTMLGIIWIMR